MVGWPEAPEPTAQPAAGSTSPTTLLWRLLPALVVGVAILVVGAWVLESGQHRQQLAAAIALTTDEVGRDLPTLLDQQVLTLSAAGQAVVADQAVRRGLRAHDGVPLAAAWQPVFDALRLENHITGLSLLDADRVCLLRLHHPDMRGDRVGNFAAVEAQRTGRSVSGLDLGTAGALTVRVVLPVRDGQTAIGFVELTKPIDDLVRALHARDGLHLAIVINKQRLQRERWEGLMRSAGRPLEWDRLPLGTVAYASQGRLPDAFVAWADRSVGRTPDEHPEAEVVFDNKTWRRSTLPLRDAAGSPIGVLLLLHDLTALNAAFSREFAVSGVSLAALLTLLLAFVVVVLRRTGRSIIAQQGAIRESEARMRAITDSANDAIIMMDPEGRISYWNPAAVSMLGFPADEAIGRVLHALITPPRYREAHHQAFPAFQLTGQGNAIGKTLELEAIHKNGREIPVELSLSALPLQTGWHTIGILRDITERRRIADEIIETNQQLEWSTARANQMAMEAELASAAKSDFLANMSHEIRTPMNGVIGMTGLLLDTALTLEQRRFADIARASGETLLSLINDILDFSKIEARKLDLETMDFDLSTLLDDFADALAARAQDKGLELLCSADADVPMQLSGDPGRLRQILTNLVGNAVKFTSAGEVAVRVSLVEPVVDQAVLRFAVRDTGIGIPADKIGLLFGKFSQVDASTTRRFGGTGLGLAISKHLAELMGGEVGVTSTEGAGSEFWFTVRLALQADQTSRVPPPPVELRGVRCLIVDDNATGREILARQLTAWHLRPSEAEDGAAALRTLAGALDDHDPFTLAIVDGQMPGMDGETLGRCIKADPALAATTMVLLTSMGVRGDASRFETIGFAAHATKPIRKDDLLAVLSQALRPRLGTAAADLAAGLTGGLVARPAVRPLLRGFAGRKSRILLAEDNITNQQVALGMLKRFGLSADAVANGSEVIHALATVPYDVILMDVQMPDMDGYQATQRIRAEGGPRCHVPIIAMTAHAMQGDRERCLAAGMNDYITKPVSPQSLAEALDRWLPTDPAAVAVQAPEAATLASEAAAAPSGTPRFDRAIFDKAALVARMMDDEDLAQQVSTTFLRTLPQEIAALRQQLASMNASGAGRLAHSIKGAAASIGAERLSALVGDLERHAKAGDLAAATARLPDIDAQVDLVQQAIGHEWSAPRCAS